MAILRNLYIIGSFYFIISVIFEEEFERYGLRKPLDFLHTKNNLNYYRDPSQAYFPSPSGVEHVTPSFAPNGSPWPTQSGYIAGYDILNNTGYSKVRVDNTKGSYDVMVKLVYHGKTMRYPVRTFYISRGEQFEVTQLNKGSYDIRYKLLETGEIFKHPTIELKEEKVGNKIRSTDFWMTLYSVVNGKIRPTRINQDEF